LLLAASYTFWSQAIVAEVYTLHILLVALCCAALLGWERRPSLARLGTFLGLYALSFGHHLSMILLMPAFTLFLLVGGRHDLKAVVGVRPVVLALIMMAFGALQYVASLQSLWFGPNPPATLAEGLRTFWVDVTKADWRESMVMGVHRVTLTDRIAMLAFDARQQFGFPGIAMAAAGLFAGLSPARLLLLAAGYVVPAGFAVGYNVGDVHVFFLTSHFMSALLAGCGAAALQRALAEVVPLRAPLASIVAGTLFVGYPAWRAWDTFPAVDRSADRRPEMLLDAFTSGLTSDNAILGADLNWQLQNGLVYYARHHKPGLPVVRTAEHMLQVPFLIHENRSHGRSFVVTEGSRLRLLAAFGSRYRIDPDPRITRPSFSTIAASAPHGTIYVLNVLTPTRDYLPLPADLSALVRVLTGGALPDTPSGAYVTLAGRSGDRPALVRQSDRPYRERLTIADVDIDVRMESWLSTDTIRRAGFGHVVANGRHALIVERGISLVTLDEQGRPNETVYANNIFQAIDRFLVSQAEWSSRIGGGEP
jgi:hypothetical protein